MTVRIARRLGVASGAVALVCVALLIVDYAGSVRRAPDEKQKVETLQEQAKLDATVAAGLHDERDRQTESSIGRAGRAKVLAWILLGAAGVFVTSGKRVMTRRPQRLPALNDLVAQRFPAPPKKRSRSSSAPPVTTPTLDAGVDLIFVDDLVTRLGRGREAAIPILQAIQTHYRYLPDEALRRVCELTEITPAQITGTSSFYAQFRRSPVGRHVVRVCHGTACHVAGAEQITQELRRHLEIAPEEDTDSLRLFTIDRVACLGCCSLAPVMMIEDETAGRLSPAGARQALDAVEPR
jgi:NADH:ubiquinone oxidoreductase subunit E